MFVSRAAATGRVSQALGSAAAALPVTPSAPDDGDVADTVTALAWLPPLPAAVKVRGGGRGAAAAATGGPRRMPGQKSRACGRGEHAPRVTRALVSSRESKRGEGVG